MCVCASPCACVRVCMPEYPSIMSELWIKYANNYRSNTYDDIFVITNNYDKEKEKNERIKCLESNRI